MEPGTALFWNGPLLFDQDDNVYRVLGNDSTTLTIKRSWWRSWLRKVWAWIKGTKAMPHGGAMRVTWEGRTAKEKKSSTRSGEVIQINWGSLWIRLDNGDVVTKKGIHVRKEGE